MKKRPHILKRRSRRSLLVEIGLIGVFAVILCIVLPLAAWICAGC